MANRPDASRREETFLALAALAFTATLIVPVAAGWFDVAAALRIQVPFASVVPVGVLVMPIAIAVMLVVSELYGRRRSVVFALALSGSALAASAVIGLTTQVLALASYAIAVHVAGAVVFDVFRLAHGRLFWVRSLIATLFAQLVGWAAFGGVLLLRGADHDAMVNVATAGLIYSAAGAFVLLVPATLAKSALAGFLGVDVVVPARVRRVVAKPERVVTIPERVVAEPERVTESPRAPSGRFARASVYPTPVPTHVPTAVPVAVVQPTSARHPIKRTESASTSQPFSNEELAFFRDGDEL